MTAKICGTHRHSVLEISRTLSALNLSHIINSVANRRDVQPRKAMRKKIGEGRVTVLVADGLRAIQQRKGLVIVVDSLSALRTSNIPLLDAGELEDIIPGLKELGPTEVSIQPLTVSALVKQAVKPSLMTEVQTFLYRVTNRALRKEAQIKFIAYMNSKLGVTALRALLGSSFALSDLLGLLGRPDVKTLRDAVTMHRKGTPVKEVEALTKCSSFDILYLVRSCDKEQASHTPKE